HPAPPPALGLLPAPTPQPPHVTADQSTFLTPFEVLDHQPYNLKRLKRTLAAHHAGLVEVKTRDQAVNPDTLQPQLRGPAPPNPQHTLTVFILRWDRAIFATITRRL
ncbi:MAG: hypothetical protein AAF823_12755, partial [Planctomycetota bacterium]